MTKLAHANSHRDLLVYVKAMQHETQHWIEVAMECGYISKQDAQSMINDCKEIGRLLGGMIKKSAAFCNPGSVREPEPEYFVEISNQ